MTPDTRQQLSTTTVTLHWVLGIAVIGMLTIGIYMYQTETYSLYPWHKSFGIVVFVLAATQVFWRLSNGWPGPVKEMPPMEYQLARTVHFILITGTLLMPISGFLMSALGGSGVAFFGLEIVARNPDPADPSQTVAHNEAVATFFRGVHGWIAYLLVASVLLHIAGALKHHLISKDGTLNRMLGKRVE